MNHQVFDATTNLNGDDAHTCAHTITTDDDQRRRPCGQMRSSDRLDVSEIIVNQSQDTDVS